MAKRLLVGAVALAIAGLFAFATPAAADPFRHRGGHSSGFTSSWSKGQVHRHHNRHDGWSRGRGFNQRFHHPGVRQKFFHDRHNFWRPSHRHWRPFNHHGRTRFWRADRRW
ncbi:MAG TPA: hypothetical protein VF274_13505 [Alphaproteobacteria bacterium]